MTASVRINKPPSAHPQKPARAIAFSILLNVETKASFASELLHTRLSDTVEPREAALATELVMGTLRWQRTLDFLIERYAKRAISSLDFEVLIALRMGIYQLRFLARIPARAAVSESVELARRARKSSAAALVNAVLRRASAERDEPITTFLPSGLSAAERLAIEHSHPHWMVERWLANFGERKAIELLQANNLPSTQSCAVLDAARREQIIESLQHAGIETAPGRLLRDALIIRKGNIAKSAALKNGWLAIQDEASQMIPLLVGTRAGDRVLDLCAAPGGKTQMLAQKAGAKGLVVACDIRESRLRAMRDRFAAANARNMALVALDGTRALPFARKFDRVLVDAPCSGTGTLARNPEIRWRLHVEDLVELHARQAALLMSAMDSVAANGRLIYSTCSLEPEENEAVIQEVLTKNPDFHAEPVKIPAGLLAQGVRANDLTDECGAFRTFPPQHHADGFFAATICRK